LDEWLRYRERHQKQQQQPHFTAEQEAAHLMAQGHAMGRQLGRELNRQLTQAIMNWMGG
jgi:hypothetical protein